MGWGSFLKGHFTHEAEGPASLLFTSATLIGGNGGAAPTSLHTTLEGPQEYVIAHPYLLVWVTSERRIATLVANNGSHWLN